MDLGRCIHINKVGKMQNVYYSMELFIMIVIRIHFWEILELLYKGQKMLYNCKTDISI